MASRWTTEDLVDLEYLLGQDAEAFEDELRPRDRAIYLALQPDGMVAPPRDALLGWLTRRRGEVQPLPGPAVAQGWRLVGMLVVGIGVLAGGSLAAGLLHYTGRRPINVAVVLGILVGLQLLSLVLLAVGFLVRAFSRAPKHPGLPTRLLRGLAARASALVGGRLGGETRASWETYAGLIGRCQRLYGKAFFWKVFARFQSAGVAFNVGILVVVLFKVMTTDLAFGWQSTLRAGAGQVHTLARAAATPWSWLAGEGIGYPSLAAVEGSRIVLKDGIYHLASEDLTAWWPFLCFAVCCYGFLPRLLLYAAARFKERWAVAGIPFRHAPCERLYRRMKVPMLQTAAAPASTDAAGGARSEGGAQKAAAGTGQGKGPVLVSHDLLDALGPDRFAAWLGPGVTPVGSPLVFGRDMDEDRQALQALSTVDAGNAVYVACEAWQPPIQEFFDLLGEARHVAGAETPIWILLAGRIGASGNAVPAREAHVKIWRQAVAQRGDPYLGLMEAGATDAS